MFLTITILIIRLRTEALLATSQWESLLGKSKRCSGSPPLLNQDQSLVFSSSFSTHHHDASIYLYSSPTSQQPNRWHCRPPGCNNYNSRPTHRRREVAFPTKWGQKQMGTLGTRIISDLVFSKPCSLCSSLPPTPPPQRRHRQPPSVVVFLEVSAFEHLLGGKCLWTPHTRELSTMAVPTTT